MKVIVGLGNPGSKYKETKHNIGFITLDEIAYRQNVSFNNSNFEADIAEFFIGTEKVLLVKPLTFMNESGRSVGPLLTYFGVDEEDLIVIYDDLDLEVGKIRLRQKGSAGGHNGIKSLIAHLGTNVFPRIKIGIGRPSKNDTVIHHVLSTFPKETHEEMLLAVKKAADAALYTCEGHTFVETMNQFNGK
ncbi:aminoacyl-tRNA hydrolase [Enterococcus faecalis]|uniref:aminoacyl-tRNA hydrolase n=1 Tax=Enterococcus faecalis TaxID=1351 RepID=UPI00103DE2BD|nr:aminoacyl-tRNA hydrolase [Enterococcus faecalis]EGO5822827.1 aminoacyl-tRNA hydrolase [Enterococcus faecalis]EGO6731569.1 aminoacyl-tRNA hydrolase [Enterococcus faecalis]EGO6732216.1 aminoacyl-tRNA hydrolase [Enterococcus faecalis]EJV6886626.1 aminoacyl-tRNA hydrolase [Enterococcus faecalis]HAP5733290.1 aminoacyl-tRNA hydrolase [Enterococcus faecalis]